MQDDASSMVKRGFRVDGMEVTGVTPKLGGDGPQKVEDIFHP